MKCKQPNGLYCRFSYVVDTITHYDMTKEQYIEMELKKVKKKLEEDFESELVDYEEMKKQFIANNVTQEEFDNICKEMEVE